MVKRGGGVEDVRFRNLGEQMMVVELLINVFEVMGANIVNSVAEATSPYILKILGQGRVGVRILSNLCTERMCLSTFSIPVHKLSWKGSAGKDVANKIIET